MLRQTFSKRAANVAATRQGSFKTAFHNGSGQRRRCGSAFAFTVVGTVAAAAATTTTAFAWGGWGGSPSQAKAAASPVAANPAAEEEAKLKAAAAAADAALPEFALSEVRQHTSRDSLWVTHEGYVYDVTAFANTHPGGHELLLTAAGLDLGHFFANYKIHTRSSKAADYLAGMKIGRLSKADAEKARLETTPAVHVDRRLAVLAAARRRMAVVAATLPLWVVVRWLVRLLGLLVPPLGRFVASRLPVSVPGYGGAERIAPVDPQTGKRRRIAVVGGGIAGCGAAYALRRSGFEVTLYEARATTSGNARTFDWDVHGRMVKTCVSVTAWPRALYKNYCALLDQIDVKTTPQYLSWFLNSRVPGHEGFLWAADPSSPDGGLRKHFQKDFDRYDVLQRWVERITNVLSFQVGQPKSMYSVQCGLGILNPLTTVPLHHLCRFFGISQEWWDIVYTPHYTASYLTDKLDNVVAVTAPILEFNVPLCPKPNNTRDCSLTTCETWANAGVGIREVFAKLTAGVDVRVSTRVLKVEHSPAEATAGSAATRNGSLTVIDEHGTSETFDRVVFACPCNAVGNMNVGHNWVEDTILATPEYADDHHPATGHMHAVMHNDASIIPAEYREDVLKRGSNYVEITRLKDGTLNIENTYNFGVQTPSLVGLPLSEKPPMLITHALGEGKSIDPKLIRGEGDHARAHPLYSGWNVLAMLSLRLMQGRRGMFYCANYTTPGNCHDMSLLSGLVAAHAVGAEYPFADNVEAQKDFHRLRTLMGI